MKNPQKSQSETTKKNKNPLQDRVIDRLKGMDKLLLTSLVRSLSEDFNARSVSSVMRFPEGTLTTKLSFAYHKEQVDGKGQSED